VCLTALLDRHWVLAGVMAGVVTASRPSGIAIVVPCLWAAAVAIRRRREWRALAAPLLAPMGMVAFFTYLRFHTGEAGAYFRTQNQAWDQHRDIFAFVHTVGTFVREPFNDDNFTLALMGMLFVALAGWWFLRKRPPGIFVAYTAATLFVAFVNRTGTDLTTVKPRTLLVAFPLITALGEDLSPPVYNAVLAGMATLLGTFTILTMAGPFTTP
jgi:LPXTG-motif cell wall-anchored protein